MNLIVETNGIIDVEEITGETLGALKNKITPEMLFKYKYPNAHWEMTNENKNIKMNEVEEKIRIFGEVFECSQEN